jgi:serine phosphatase RsbU (regulator of sigma subunit)
LPAALASQYQLLLKHAETVLRQQELVDPLIARATSGEFDHAALALVAAYSDSFEAAVASSNRYRSALYVCVVVLLIAVVGIGVKLREVYANLELMVADRTRRLQKALEELWGEMALAKKIQTALVPRTPRLKDCDVAAIMLPADQVGGDYYDVVSIQGNEWILIGDVSGHGVPAGLVMMMCQTAVHTVLELAPDIAPEKLLAIVNRSLTANIERLGEDKYMTINAMSRRPDGVIQYAGMHQDIFIYRAASSSIEEIKADGICLGLSASIEDKLVTGSFRLGEGDVLLLYTDGITEAVRDGRMLDGDGLKELLRELGAGDAQQIVSGIISRLQGYAVSDDVTALAIKQLRAA